MSSLSENSGSCSQAAALQKIRDKWVEDASSFLEEDWSIYPATQSSTGKFYCSMSHTSQYFKQYLPLAPPPQPPKQVHSVQTWTGYIGESGRLCKVCKGYVRKVEKKAVKVMTTLPPPPRAPYMPYYGRGGGYRGRRNGYVRRR